MEVARRTGAAVLLAVMAAGCSTDKAKQDESSANASIPVWTLSTTSDEARKRVEAGERLSDGGHPLKAYEQFKRAVAADSAFAYAYLRVAETGLSADEFTTNLQRAEAYAATANETERLLIQIDRKSLDNDIQGALELTQQLTAREAKNPRSWLTLAFQQQGMGQVAEARATFQKAVDLAPRSGLPLLSLGNSYVRLEPRDFSKAEQYVLAGQKLWPEEPLSYDFLGAVRRAQGRLEEAAAAYSRLIELEPQAPRSFGLRGNAYTFLGQYDKARADYDASIRVSKREEVPYNAVNRALISVYAGDLNAAIKELDQVAQSVDGLQLADPDGPKARTYEYELILASYRHRFDVADKALVQYAALSRKRADKTGSAGFRRSTDAQIAYNEGMVAAFKGDYATTERKAVEIVKLREADRDPTKDRPVHTLRGFIALFQKKDYATAVSEFNQADPTDMLIAYHRALALEGAGRTADAKALFTKIANYNFLSPEPAAVRSDAIAKAK